MLSSALGGNVCDGAFDDFQKRLLYAFARYVAGDGYVFALSCNLVDFVDIDNTALGFFDVVVGVLNKFKKNIFDVFPDVARFG